MATILRQFPSTMEKSSFFLQTENWISSTLQIKLPFSRPSSPFNSKPKSEPELTERQKTKVIVRRFLERMEFNPNTAKPECQSVLDGIHKYIKSLNPPLPPKMEKRAYRYAPIMAKVAKVFYPLHSEELQVRIGVNSMYVGILDDSRDEFGDDILYFSKRFNLCEKQPNVVLEHFANFLREWYFTGHYGPYAASIFIKSCLDFFSGSYLENELEKENSIANIPEKATAFPRFLRMKAGYGEQYAHQILPEELVPEKQYLKDYIFVIPDLVDIVDFFNDILSFFKESVIGDEQTNLISTYAKAYGISNTDALEVFCNKAFEAWERINKSVKNEEVLRVIRASVMGYLTFEARLDRYKMMELFEGEYITEYL